MQKKTMRQQTSAQCFERMQQQHREKAVLILIRSRIFVISIRCGILQCIVQKSVYRNFITYHKLRLFWDVVRRLEWLFFAIKIPEKCKIAENKNMRDKTIWSMYPDFIFNFIRIWRTENDKKKHDFDAKWSWWWFTRVNHWNYDGWTWPRESKYVKTIDVSFTPDDEEYIQKLPLKPSTAANEKKGAAEVATASVTVMMVVVADRKMNKWNVNIDSL